MTNVFKLHLFAKQKKIIYSKYIIFKRLFVLIAIAFIFLSSIAPKAVDPITNGTPTFKTQGDDKGISAPDP